MGKITFLGTGTSQGVPMIGCSCPVCKSNDPKDNRLRCSALVEENGFKILIDCGPDFRQQMLREGITDLDAVLLTHQHKDHTGGLDDIRAFNYFRQEAFPIYAEPIVQDSLKMEYSYAFADFKYPGVPEYDLRTIGEAPFTLTKETPEGIRTLEIIPIRVIHLHLPILGFRIGELVYITDANYIAPEEILKAQQAKILVINTVRLEKHISHYSLPEALAAAKEIGAGRTYLTHLSHQIGKHKELSERLYQIRQEAPESTPELVFPAYDMLTVAY